MPSVAPFVGAWIEINCDVRIHNVYYVAPFVGAWIEICSLVVVTPGVVVAPFVGAWIEMQFFLRFRLRSRSLRSSERGLKYVKLFKGVEKNGRSVRRSVD